MTKQSTDHGEFYYQTKRELEAAGITGDKSSPAAASVYHTVLKLSDTFEKNNLNSFTATTSRGLFLALLDGQLLSEVTNNPAEWEPTENEGILRNVRNNALLSKDGGLNWYREDTEATGASKVVTEVSDGSEA